MEGARFKEAFLDLFREAFDGIAPDAGGTWFVQGKEGLFDTFAAVNAVQASASPKPGMSSIAAHIVHARYYLSQSNAVARGERPTYDWEGSWAQQTVNESEWDALRDGLRFDYVEFCSHVRALDDPDPDVLGGVLANLAHASFHLGAVRQLIKLVSP